MRTARVSSQSMVLEDMKNDDEFRVREHGGVLSTTPTKPTSVGAFVLSLRGRGFDGAQSLAAPVCARESQLCSELGWGCLFLDLSYLSLSFSSRSESFVATRHDMPSLKI